MVARVRRLMVIAFVAVITLALMLSVVLAPKEEQRQIESTDAEPLPDGQDPSTFKCTTNCDKLINDPTEPSNPELPTKGIGTAFVTITVRFTDGTEKVLTQTFSLLTVTVEGKTVSSIQYKVEVTFENLGDVYVSSMRYGLYLVPTTSAGQPDMTGGTGYSVVTYSGGASPIRVPAGTRVALIDLVVTASQIEDFFRTNTIPDGSYILRFWAGFYWAGTTVQFTNADGTTSTMPGFGQASISGPDFLATVTIPVVFDGGGGISPPKEICIDTEKICIM